MKLYRESGISPLGCILPMVIQMPIWIALYQSIMRALAVTPEALADLSGHLYSWPLVNKLAPLGSNFLWINLSVPDGTMLLPILVGATMWVQQKMVATPSADPRQQSMTNMMQWMLPLMFVMFSLSFPAGLALYWLFSNILGIAIQYVAVGGWGGLEPVAQMLKRRPKEQPQAAKGK
jgi:YidC/Oxa1 family membrane protein insertase